LIKLLFDKYSVHKINAITDVRNAKSIGLMKKLNFRQEAHFVKSYWDEIDKDWIDELQFAILNK